MRSLVLSLILAGAGLAAQAEDVTTYPFDGDFGDATFGLENAIVGRGLVVDHISHVGEMLNRTGADLGAATQIYDNADVYQFCSAVVSRKMMEADPLNIAWCPYGIFVTDRGGEVLIGYRNMPDGVMQEVQTLLDEIVREAVGL